ncbi:MAG: hypothetical protein V4757_07135 [Pseudomonadota bacterium]
MSAFYDNLQATATRLIKQYGSAMVLRRAGPATYNPATGTSSSTPTDFPCTGVELDFDTRSIDGTLVKVGDRKVYIEAESFDVVPQPGDRIVAGGVAREVIRSKPLAPGGQVLLHEVQVRK